MKTIEELKKEIIELKQQLELTTITEDRHRLMKQILDMTIELAEIQYPDLKVK
jgi:hypothetical protein